MNVSKSESKAALCFGAALEINAAEPLRQALLEHLEAHSEPVVDLKSVTSCDTAGAQLLYSAALAAGLARKTIRFKNVPPVVAEVWKRLGMPPKLFTNPAPAP